MIFWLYNFTKMLKIKVVKGSRPLLGWFQLAWLILEVSFESTIPREIKGGFKLLQKRDKSVLYYKNKRFEYLGKNYERWSESNKALKYVKLNISFNFIVLRLAWWISRKGLLKFWKLQRYIKWSHIWKRLLRRRKKM
jgi:hypothetical protein